MCVCGFKEKGEKSPAFLWPRVSAPWTSRPPLIRVGGAIRSFAWISAGRLRALDHNGYDSPRSFFSSSQIIKKKTYVINSQDHHPPNSLERNAPADAAQSSSNFRSNQNCSKWRSSDTLLTHASSTLRMIQIPWRAYWIWLPNTFYC